MVRSPTLRRRAAFLLIESAEGGRSRETSSTAYYAYSRWGAVMAVQELLPA